MSVTLEAWDKTLITRLTQLGKRADEQWRNINETDPHRISDLVRSDAKTAARDIGEVVTLAKARPSAPLSADDFVGKTTEMYRGLGLWLSWYWAGLACPGLWPEVASMADDLEGFPGGAFYLKLAGDVLRFHRRRRSQIQKFAVEDTHTECVYILAHTPVVLVPDDADVTHVAHIGAEYSEMASEVEKLACRFHRYQLWRYLHAGGHLTYMVSRSSASKYLYDVASRTVDMQPDSRHLHADEKEKRVQELVVNLQREGVSRVGKYFTSDRSEYQRLVVVAGSILRGTGATSCVIGAEAGVSANRPHRSGEQTAMCYWVDRNGRDYEMMKINGVLERTVREQRPDRVFRYVAGQPFDWYDPAEALRASSRPR